MESYLPRPSSTDPQVYVTHAGTIQGSYLPRPSSTDPQVYVPRDGGIGTRSFLTSTPSYNHHGNQEHCLRSAIPQCHFQNLPTRIPNKLQSQSCRPILIQNNHTDHSFEFRPNHRNSFSSHQGWKDSLPQWSEISTKNCSMDMCSDGFCNKLPPQKKFCKNGICSSPPPQRSVPAMMHVINEDRVTSTSDEESAGDISEIYSMSVNIDSFTTNGMAPVLEAKNLYSWIIKVLPDNSGPCVEGKLEKEDDTYWHSSLIAVRLESHLVQTVSGKVYRLMGDMEINDALTGGFDEQTVSEFIDGFPIHWRELMDQFFSQKQFNGHTKLSENTMSTELLMSAASGDLSDDDNEISLLDETVKPKEKRRKPEDAQQNSEKKTTKSKKVVKAKENLKPKRQFNGFTKLSENTVSTELPRNAAASDLSDDDDNEISLLDETVKPKEKRRKPEDAQQNSEKKTTKSKKVVKAKENLKPRNVGRLKKKKQGKGFQSPVSSGNVIEVCTPGDKLIKLDSVQKTRSGRPVKPVVAWYAGQSISIDPKSNTYILKHRTQFAETFLNDMTEFNKTRSHTIRKTGMLNTSRISNTSRPHHKNTMSTGNQVDISHRKTAKTIIQSKKNVSKVLVSSQTEREGVASTNSEQRPRKDRNVSDSTKAKSSPSAGKRKVSNSTKTKSSPSAEKRNLSDSTKTKSSPSAGKRKVSNSTKTKSSPSAEKRNVSDSTKTKSSPSAGKRNVSDSTKTKSSPSAGKRKVSNSTKTKSSPSAGKRNVSDSTKAKRSPSAGKRRVDKSRTFSENKKDSRRSSNKKPGQPESSRRNVPRSCNLRKRSVSTDSNKSEASTDSTKELQRSNMTSHKSKLGKQTEKENQEHAVWTKEEVTRFNMITRKLHQDDPEFWNKVVKNVKTKTLEECQEYFYKEVPSKSHSKPAKSKDTEEQQIALTAKRGTLKRKQQLRNLVNHANKAYQEDLFDGTPYRHHSKIPRLSDGEQEDVFAELSRRNPHMKNKIFTPMARINVAPVSTKKTPSSGLVGSDTKINRKEADHYMHKMKIQRRKLVTKSQSKTPKDTVKEKIPVPSKKLFGRSDDLQSLFMEGCGSDSNHDNSEEEIDYYFSGEEES